MPTKPILIAITVIALLALYLKQNPSKQAEPTPVEANTTVSTIHKQEEQKKTTVKQLVEKKTPVENNEVEIEKQNLVTKFAYDADPVVDASMIINTHKLCISQLSNKLNESVYMKRLQKNLDEKQLKFYKNLNNYCQQLNQQHPEYNLSNAKMLREQLSKAKPISIWGKIINGEIDANELSNYEVEDLIQQNSIAILTEAPKYLQKYYQEVIHWDMEDVLQNHQYDYTQHITQYAHQLYLCQIGSECGPNSTMMSVLCFYNSQACGLNYPQYIKDVLTLGQQADIQLAISYLQTKYGSN